MNRQFDIIVVGDSKAGNAVVKSIAEASRKINIAFISREFKNSITRNFLNVEHIKGEVTFTDYKNRLFGCYMKNGDRHFCTHLIIASGINYEPLYAGNRQVPGVFNTANEIPKGTKNQVAAVFGNREADAKLALAVAKKYKYVYLCAESMSLEASEATRKKVDASENILVLSNASLKKATFADGILASVSLDNYSNITCNAIFAQTPSKPATAFVSDKLITKDEFGYLKTSSISQSLLVPKCFAIGNCVNKSTKKMQQALVEAVLSDF